MEKNPAACAVDWSIQLEKSLRSPKPGKSIEAVEEIGVRLEWWDREPELTFAEYKMFGLIPGEDKLFLNAIFLRLADAFRLGNKQIKNAVVKLFLRMKKRKKRVGEGILSKGKLENCLEFLSRLKEVFDKGDDEERAMALVLFGCWAYFSKDCLDIRYIVLSSLVADGVFEVKAALFAAGCMSELSDDFANVFLEILATVALSSDISRCIKLAGGQVFSKMCCSFSVANKAYKTGLKLLMESSEDDFSAVMLISLSKIASRWTLLIPAQIELLKLFLSEERSVHLQVTSLRCHSFVLARGVCNLPSSTDTVNKLFGTLQSSELQPTLQIEAFRILHKVLVEYRNKDNNHVDWVKALKELYTPGLRDYVKTHFPLGPVWNATGKTFSAASTKAPTAPSPPPAPAPPPAPTSWRNTSRPSSWRNTSRPSSWCNTSGPKDGMAAVFQAIKSGSAISGLKKVTADMKTKNRADRSGVVSDSEKESRSTSAFAPKTGPPKLELEMGRKWVVENQIEQKNLVIDECDSKQSVYVYGCKNSVLQIQGKVNNITVDKCTKMGVVFKDLVAACEIVNCNSIEVQSQGTTPTISVDNTSGCQLYLSKDSLGVSITTAKSSEINVLVPASESDGDWGEHSLPQQYVHVYKDGQFETTPVSHSGA